MSQKFDPMTGEPIAEEAKQEENVMKFDPMTGEPIAEEAKQEESVMKFDPMTGEPIAEEAKQEENVMKFDPMTGEPIAEKAKQEETVVQYDPMTGKPVTEKKMPKKILAVGAAVLVVVVFVIAGVLSGAFLSKQNKVLLAISNTFQDETNLTTAFEAVELLNSDSYTLSVNGEVQNNSIKAAFASKGSEKQLSGKIDISGVPEIEGIIGLDSKEVRAQTDYTGDTVFVYSYKNENDGYLMDSMDDDDVEMLNQILESMASTKKQDDIQKELANVLFEEYKKWKFEKVSKEEFEIDGKDRKCKGYQTTITEDDILDLMDAAYDVLSELYVDDTLEKSYKELTDEFNNMPDVDVTFYIYKNMLAAVVLDDGDHELEVQFNGGVARWHNIIVKENHETILRLKGEVDGSTEEYELQIEGVELGTLEYDKKTGELEIEVGSNLLGTAFFMDANVKGNKNKLTFTLDSIEVSGRNIDCSGEVVLKKGAKIQKISGDEFDLGNADEDEFEELERNLNNVGL